MKFFPTLRNIAAIALLSSQSLFAGLTSETSSMKDFQTGAEKLTVYTDVPGHQTSIINGYASRAKSDIYEIWIRSAATDNVWVQCFANMTYNRGAEMPILTGFNTATATHAYQRHTAGWTHTYANVEMSNDSNIEVEIRKIGATLLDGEIGIIKAAVHPAQKIIPGSQKLENGRVYFKMNRPGQVVIDINGQMDDHNAAYPSTDPFGRMPNNQPVHSVAFYANPIMAKPVASPTNRVLTIQPSESNPTTRLIQPDPATYDTMSFAPGIHNVGAGFKLHPGKNYYIPGDSIIYGSIGNLGVPKSIYRSNGDRINIFGYGSICSIQIPHHQNDTDNPQYPEWNAWDGEKDQGVSIEIQNAWDTKITGVTVIDPANFNTKFDGELSRSNDQSLVSWVKLHSWRVNGDGFGGYAKVEDSFFRTSDDSTYVRDWRRRCTFWKDTNANIFRFVNYKSGGITDCDVIYARWRDPRGVGIVFEFASSVDVTDRVYPINLLMKDIRFHDKLANPTRLISLDTLEKFSGIIFENISFYLPKNGYKSDFLGSDITPYYGGIAFKNITYQDGVAGTPPVTLNKDNFSTYFTTSNVDFLLFDDPANFNLTLNYDAQRGDVQKVTQFSQVTLSAFPKPTFAFKNWVLPPNFRLPPGMTAQSNPLTIYMTESTEISAEFEVAEITAPVIVDTPRAGSWVVPDGVYSMTIQTWSGGGAGGTVMHTPGATTVSIRGGGGAGGSYAQKTLQVWPGQVIEYQAGAGGISSPMGFADLSTSGNGQASFISVNGITSTYAIGGIGGQNRFGTTSSLDGNGGIAPTTGNLGDIIFYGGNGARSNAVGTGGGGGSAGSAGSGGNASSGSVAGIAGLGDGAAGAVGHNFTAVGNQGGYPGGGGSGGGIRNNTGANAIRLGGNGGNGKVIVTYNTLDIDFTLNTQPSTGGTISGGGTYDAGTNVSVTAIALPGYRFEGWGGALSGSTNPTTIRMDNHTTITANFIPVYSLTSSAVNGSISFNPPGGVYDEGTEVQVTASASAGYRFGSWSGAAVGTSTTTTVVMTSDLSVTADFIQQVTLTTISPNGSISLSPAGSIYDINSVVSLTAVPNAGYRFTGWSGAASGTNTSTTVLMDASKSVTATFAPLFILSTTASNGSISLSPAGGVYDLGTVVTLTATPNSGYRFNSWSGAATGTSTSTTVVMDGNKSVTASFIRQFTLTATATNGSVTLSPAGGTYDTGTVVTVTAVPAAGFVFNGWNGALSGLTNPSTILMDANKTVAANFSATLVESFSTVGTSNWVCPEGVTSVTVECWGAGGAAGSVKYSTTSSTSTTIRAGGGAGGSYSQSIVPVTPGTTYKVVVGAGGRPISVFPSTAPSAAEPIQRGEASRFTDSALTTEYVKAVGGVGGANANKTSGKTNLNTAGGIASAAGNIGQVSYAGGNGASGGSTFGGGGGGGAGDSAVGGNAIGITAGIGGVTGGGNGAAGRNVANAAALSATGIGGGGGGTLVSKGNTQFGGSGGPGFVRLSYVPSLVPSPWIATDIGAVAVSGTTSYASPVWTIQGSGADIWSSADEFRYVYQSASEDCSIVARVTSLTNTNQWAKSGVMIRESTAANAINAMVCLTPSNGVSFQWRNTTGGISSFTSTAVSFAPKWLKLTRTGNSIAAFCSDDNSTWIPVGTPQTINMAVNVTLGLAVTSHLDGVLTTSLVEGVTANP